MKTHKISPDARYVANNGKHYHIVKTATGDYCANELRDNGNGQYVGTGRGVFFDSQRHAVHACEAHSTQQTAVFTYEHKAPFRTVGTRQKQSITQGAAA